MNIDDMLYEAENGKRSPILDRITEEAEPFWRGCEERVKSGRNIKPYVVSRLLKENGNVQRTSKPTCLRQILGLSSLNFQKVTI